LLVGLSGCALPGLLLAQAAYDDLRTVDAGPGASAARANLPSTFTTGDGKKLPIQREWKVEEDPSPYKEVAFEEQPFRFDQRQPTHVYTEQRFGQEPLYYFKDVRWVQKDRPAGTKLGRQAFYTSVVVDPEKVKAAYFCMKPFAPKFVAGHAAIFLEFDEGGFKNLDGATTPGFVLSYEAYLRVTQSYDLIGGQFSDKFRIVYVGSTWRDFLIRSVQFNKSVVKRWKLKLSREELRALAKAVGRTVMADHSDETYNTTRRSCVTAALRLVNDAVPTKRRMSEKWLLGLVQNPGWALPVLADNALRFHGLVEGRKQTIAEVPAE
jgi:hypothetical protein